MYVVGARNARAATVGTVERRWFERLNRLSARWHAPVWAFMQLGSLAGIAAASGAIWAAGRHRTALRVAVSGLLAWSLSKAVKGTVGRGRPAAVLSARILGREQSGLGYPSGHAAVTAAMAYAAAPELRASVRKLAWLAPLAVGSSRMYVGAHLPLDVAGGAALGAAAGAVANLAFSATEPDHGSRVAPKSSPSARWSSRRG